MSDLREGDDEGGAARPARHARPTGPDAAGSTHRSGGAAGEASPASIGGSAAKLDRAAGSPAPLATAPWLAARDAVLRALVHDLSNRAGTVAAVAGVLAPDAPARGRLVEALQGEGERLVALVERFRHLLPPPEAVADDAPTEPVLVGPLLDEAAALAASHPALRDAGCAVADVAGVPPVRVAPDRVRLLVLALAVEAAEAGRPVRLGARALGGRVRLTVVAEETGDAVDASWTIEVPALGAG